MKTDLSLRPILKKHLPPIESHKDFLAGFGDEALALKFFEFFGAGSRNYIGVKGPRDDVELSDLIGLLRKAVDAYLRLSRTVKVTVEDEYYFLETWQSGQGSRTKERAQHLEEKSVQEALDQSLYETGFGLSEGEIDEPESEQTLMAAAQGGDHLTPAQLRLSNLFPDLLRILEAVEHDYADQYLRVQKRVDWGVCAVTQVACSAWFVRTGKNPPKAVHADAPGPFGAFLEDILAELFALYGRKPDSQPSARSALRALENITNSSVDFRHNWQFLTEFKMRCCPMKQHGVQ